MDPGHRAFRRHPRNTCRHHPHPSLGWPAQIRHGVHGTARRTPVDRAARGRGAHGNGRWHLACDAGAFAVTDFTNERGLLGVAAHPQFASNGFIYVYYTTAQGGTHNRISRFTVSGNTASGEVALVDLPTLTSTSHNGGAMHFGSDGKLYVAVGDNQVGANSQNLNSPLGKPLRLNDDGSIPSTSRTPPREGNLACAAGPKGCATCSPCRVPAHRPHSCQRRRSRLWEEINARCAAPTLDGHDRRTHQRHRRHRRCSRTRTSAMRWSRRAMARAASSWGMHHRRRVLPEQRPLPAPWRGYFFFSDFIAPFVGFIDLNNGNAAYSFGSVTEQSLGMLVTRSGALLVLHRGSDHSLRGLKEMPAVARVNPCGLAADRAADKGLHPGHTEARAPRATPLRQCGPR